MNDEPKNTNDKPYIKPQRFFENSGTVDPNASYFVRLENVTNTNKQDIKTMVDRGRYFTIFAPRQSGKTTFLKETCRSLQIDPTYAAITLSFQEYNSIDKVRFYSLIGKNFSAQLTARLKQVNCEKTEAVERFLSDYQITDHLSFKHLFEELNRIILLKKIVIFIDEFDGILLSELGNFLNALRALYQDYKFVEQKALYSVGLIGIRNVTKLVVGGVSPFNIADQVVLPSFSLKNVHDLYAQYTGETNQPFTGEAVKRVYEETAGQPWLVNRLGTILTTDIKPGTTEPINELDVEKAVRELLLEKNVHFDNLYEKAKLYKETFLDIVFDNVEYSPYDEQQSWLEQYGLIRNQNGKAVVSNNIYKAIHIRAFFKEAQSSGEIKIQDYKLPEERLNMEKILLDFAQYISEIGVRAFYDEQKPYEKTGLFLLTAWLYQFVKGGEGDLKYETPTGLGRMDIFLKFNRWKYIIETKVNRDNLSTTIQKGVKQMVEKYLASESYNEGYLVIFDTKKPVGAVCDPEYHDAGNKNKRIIGFTVGIGNRSVA